MHLCGHPKRLDADSPEKEQAVCRRLPNILWIGTGLVALVWHLVRVLPKPSRATYPCQRVAAPLAWGFVGSLFGLSAAVAFFRRARGYAWEHRYLLATGSGLISLVAAAWTLSTHPRTAKAFTPSDPPNTPMGVAKGIFPGRVVWVYDRAATPWDGSTGNWWSDTGTSQASVDGMVSRAIRSLTGTGDDAAAWAALFRHYNQTHGRGEVGYQPGEKIAIKINCNNTTHYGDSDNQVDASPHMVLSLLRQLVNQAGVPQNLITVYEAPNTAPTRIIPNRVFNKCRAEFPNVVFADCVGTNGRTLVQWTNNVLSYAVTNAWPDGSPCGRNLPTCVRQATYLINLALMKGHNTAGVTLTAKNHYGSINSREHWYIRTADRTMPLYNPLVDLTGHKDLGGKTILFMIDALYGASDVGNTPAKFQLPPFNNAWSSSLFVSQDPIAIDSVGLDFLNSEFGSQAFMNKCDNYLHEGAQANNPPSGRFYDPEGDGTRLASLGVHEHWNDVYRRQYSRNLGTGNGIELVYVSDAPFVMDGDADQAGYLLAENSGMRLYGKVIGSNLYVATWSARDGANDHFIFVQDGPEGAYAAPWAKAGTVAHNTATKPYLAGESVSGYAAWYNAGSGALFAHGPAGRQLEGTLNLQQAFGSVPDRVYLAACPYATINGGALLASHQVPAGNGDGNLDPNEFVALEVDRDGDGMPDWWERKHFGLPDGPGGDEDEDGDGFVNWNEYVAGTDPTNAASLLKAGAARQGAGLVLSWPSVAGKRYRVGRAEQLPGPFTDAGGDLPATPPVNTYTDSPPAAPTLFYRVGVR